MVNGSIYKRYVPALCPKDNDPEAAWIFAFDSNKILVKTDGDAVSIPYMEDLHGQDIEFIDNQYLGEFDGLPCYCSSVKDGTAAPEGMEFRDLRSLLGLFEDDVFLLVGRAFQIVNWDRQTKYCGKCGSKTEARKNERSKICPKCSSVFYPRLSPAIIVAVIRGDKILLAHNKNFRQNWYSVIAGFVEPGETFEDCVKREVMEEVGISVNNIKYFGSQPWPFPDSLMIGFTAEYEGGEIHVDGVEIDDAGWYRAGELPQTPSKVSVAGQLIHWFLDNIPQQQE